MTLMHALKLMGVIIGLGVIGWAVLGLIIMAGLAWLWSPQPHSAYHREAQRARAIQFLEWRGRRSR